MSAFAAPAKAIAQCDDPVFLRVLLQSLLWTVAVFAGLVWLVVWGSQTIVADHLAAGWLQWLAGLVAGVGAIFGALYFFVPVATVIATLFVDHVADAVERRFYPALPPGRPAPLAAQAWDAVALGSRVLALQTLGLLLALLLPGVGVLLGWLIAAWAIGRGLFVAVAMRRMDRARATALYARVRGAVLLQGGLIAAASAVPILNLAVPVLGVAAMVHVLHDRNRTGF